MVTIHKNAQRYKKKCTNTRKIVESLLLARFFLYLGCVRVAVASRRDPPCGRCHRRYNHATLREDEVRIILRRATVASVFPRISRISTDNKEDQCKSVKLGEWKSVISASSPITILAKSLSFRCQLRRIYVTYT